MATYFVISMMKEYLSLRWSRQAEEAIYGI